MIRRLIYFPFFLLASFILCQAQEKVVSDIRFPGTRALRSASFDVPDIVFGKTTALIVTNDYIVFARGFTEPLFHVFDVSDGRYLGSFGRRGKGPLDFELADPRTAMKTAKGFKIFDIHKGWAFVDLSGYREGEKFNLKFNPLPQELYILNDAIQLNKNTVIGLPDGWKTDKMNVRYDIPTGKIVYFGEYPAIYPEKYKKYYWGVFWRHSVPKPDGTKFASFFDGVKMFRIYNEKGDLEVEKVMKIYKIFEGGSISSAPKKVYYNVVRATDEYIYALCQDAIRDRLPESYPVVEVWDWQGNPVYKFIPDHHIQSFDITPDGKRIFAVDREISDKLFYYDLPLPE